MAEVSGVLFFVRGVGTAIKMTLHFFSSCQSVVARKFPRTALSSSSFISFMKLLQALSWLTRFASMSIPVTFIPAFAIAMAVGTPT